MQKKILFLLLMLFFNTMYAEDKIENNTIAIYLTNNQEKKDNIEKLSQENAAEDQEEDIEKLLEENTAQYNWEALDPFEEYNKNTLSLNMFIFRKTILPTIFFVDAWVPKKARIGYTNFINNLIEPRNALIYRLNKNNKGAKIALKRFLTNTVFGMLGFINVAELRWGPEYKSKRMSLDCVFRNKHKLGRYMIVPITNQYFERPLLSDTFDILMNPTFYFAFPFNYLLYIMDKVVILGKDKTLLYRNRQYNEGVYKALRDSEIFNTLNDEKCK